MGPATHSFSHPHASLSSCSSSTQPTPPRRSRFRQLRCLPPPVHRLVEFPWVLCAQATQQGGSFSTSSSNGRAPMRLIMGEILVLPGCVKPMQQHFRKRMFLRGCPMKSAGYHVPIRYKYNQKASGVAHFGVKMRFLEDGCRFGRTRAAAADYNSLALKNLHLTHA